MAAERHIRAMGTDVGVIVVGNDADPSDRLTNRLADQALTRIAELESLWSRFRPDSEVSRLNAAAGTAVQVSTDTVHLVRRAVDAWRLSAGFVDGTELAAIIEAGYDRSFEELPPDRTPPVHDGARRPMTFAGPGDITIDGHAVTIPLGVGFDPGGIGKGLAADLVSAELITAGAAGVCINMGGDLRVRGIGPRGVHCWTIALEHPQRPTPLAMVGITDGGVASSTTLRRRWLVGGEVRHHLIDPRTGRPSDSSIAFCSVVADAAWKAETLAKAILLRGSDHPFDLIDGTGVEALIVDRSGAVACSPGFTRFTGGHAPPSHITRVLEGVVA